MPAGKPGSGQKRHPLTVDAPSRFTSVSPAQARSRHASNASVTATGTAKSVIGTAKSVIMRGFMSAG